MIEAFQSVTRDQIEEMCRIRRSLPLSAILEAGGEARKVCIEMAGHGWMNATSSFINAMNRGVHSAWKDSSHHVDPFDLNTMMTVAEETALALIAKKNLDRKYFEIITKPVADTLREAFTAAVASEEPLFVADMAPRPPLRPRRAPEPAEDGPTPPVAAPRAGKRGRGRPPAQPTATPSGDLNAEEKARIRAALMDDDEEDGLTFEPTGEKPALDHVEDVVVKEVVNGNVFVERTLNGWGIFDADVPGMSSVADGNIQDEATAYEIASAQGWNIVPRPEAHYDPGKPISFFDDLEKDSEGVAEEPVPTQAPVVTTASDPKAGSDTGEQSVTSSESEDWFNE